MYLPEMWWLDCIIQNDYADTHVRIKSFQIMQQFHQRIVRLKSGLNLILEDNDTDMLIRCRPFQLLSIFVISVHA